MTDIAPASLGTQLQTNVFALKLQLQRDAGVVALVKQATESAKQGNEPSTSRSRLVDVLV
jgi:hypothetical protein